MKKRILLFAAIAGIGTVTLSSYQAGPAASPLHLNRTGSPGSSGASCGTPSAGCHAGQSSSITVGIEVDSANVPVNSYKPGMTYTVKITGSSESASLSKFGFQFASTVGSTGAQAGTPGSFPANVHSQSVGGLTIVEHGSPLPAAGTSYSTSFSWTAPAAGIGDVHMYCTLNAVNANGSADANDLNNNRNISISEQTGGVGVHNLSSDISIVAYPNPVGNMLNLKMDNASNGTYTLNVFDMGGKRVMSQNIEVKSNSNSSAINTTNLAPGLYNIQLSKDGAHRCISVVKQ